MNVRLKTLAPASTQGSLGFNDRMKEGMKTLEHVISSKTKAINGLVVRNGGRGLVGVLLEFIRGVRPQLRPSVVRQVACFAFLANRLVLKSGFKGATLYFKACQVMLQQSVGGNRVLDLSDLKVRPKRNRAGVPLVIPAGSRRLLTRDRDIPTIRLWMTLFGMYRIFEFPGTLSFDSITLPGVDLKKVSPRFEEFVEHHFKRYLEEIRPFPHMGKVRLFPILKSGPTSEGVPLVSTSVFSLIRAARLLVRSTVFDAMGNIATQMGAPVLLNRLRLVASASHELLDQDIWWAHMIPKGVRAGVGYLGKLGFKIEPAGKVRVFAMVDPWSQWLLAPLHDWIFRLLRSINRVDGTFDQSAPVLRLQSKFSNRSKGRTFSSIDLSAATDRLPISLQVILLRSMLKTIVPDSGSFAQNWADLLVGRLYSVRVSKQLRESLESKPDRIDDVKYAVGQPMGALSSWAMLALTHHAILQWAAFRAGKRTWFEDYAILGDDIVIADGQVSYQYRLILEEIGVKAGLAKSVVSRSKFVLEFAKKFFVDSSTATMLPIKECIATRSSTGLVVEFVRKHSMTLNALLAFLGYGHKSRTNAVHSNLFSLSTRLRVLVVWLSHPLSPLSNRTWYSWLAMKSLKDEHSPSHGVLSSIVDKLFKLIAEKRLAVAAFVLDYERSAHNVVKKANLTAPVKITTPNLVGSVDRGFEKSDLDWSVILNPDLSSRTEVDIEYGKTGLFGLDRRDTHAALDLKVDRKWFLQFVGPVKFSAEMPESRDLMTSENYKTLITDLMAHYYASDSITNHLPTSYWAQMREELKPFKDFLEIYKVWQELSRPIWSEYYITKNRRSKKLLGTKNIGLMDLMVVPQPKLLMDLYPSRIAWVGSPIRFASYKGPNWLKVTWGILLVLLKWSAMGFGLMLSVLIAYEIGAGTHSDVNEYDLINHIDLRPYRSIQGLESTYEPLIGIIVGGVVLVVLLVWWYSTPSGGDASAPWDLF